MKKRWLVISIIVIAAVSTLTYKLTIHKRTIMKPQPLASSLRLTSSAFVDGADIPAKYTCKGDNINPPLVISGVPTGTVSLALIMHDPDAPSGDFVHWVVWDISTNTKTINENSVPTGALQGTNNLRQASYTGPCPPSGTHHYHFDLYGLNKHLDLKEGTAALELQKQIQNHIIDQTTLIGLFSKQ